MQTDIEIAQAATLQPIVNVALQLGLQADDLTVFGRHMAKLSVACTDKIAQKAADNTAPKAKLILVTAISPTPAGEGKTTTTIGLADALNLAFKQSGSAKKAVACLREPSLGPVFGKKGGATGGGFAQVLPMEEINLHFTGDFHAITSANNLLAALIDNHLYQGNVLNIDANTITWRRCLDMNDRALRSVQLNHETQDVKSVPRDSAFDITVASEVMAIFCLANSLADLTARLGNIHVALNAAGKPVLASDLQAEGAMTALLKQAFQPNLVQTIAHTPAIVHGGPFANIAHGCNSVMATTAALNLADIVVTEAGFGADLGAEKFIDIKCRAMGIAPDVVVLVATIRALKYHGGVEVADLNAENLTALNIGIANLRKHIENLTQHFGLQVVVAINHFVSDTAAEVALLQAETAKLGVKAVLCQHWAHGATGALELANALLSSFNPANEKLNVFSQTHFSPSSFKYCYANADTLLQKIEAIAQKIYGASGVALSENAAKALISLEEDYKHYPVCIAKTQYSFSANPQLRGAPTGHVLPVRELRLSRGAGFIVVVCGEIMTMPGLPKHPASENMYVNPNGDIVGLS